MKGLTFQNPEPSGPDLTGDYVLRNIFDVDMSRTKWENSIIIFVMALVYRVMFYALIRASETLIPAARSYVLKKSSSLLVPFEKRSKKADEIVA